MSDERLAPPVAAGAGVPARIERVPPHSLEAEVSVLGAALLSANATSDVAQYLSPEYFYRHAHRLVFEAVQALHTAGDAVDTVTVTEWLDRRDRLDEVGGPAAIHDLVAAVPTAANAAHYARIVRQKALLRRLIEAGTEVVRLGFEDTDDADTVVDRAESVIYDVAQSGADSEYSRLGDLLTTSFEQIERLAEHGSEVTGLATGFNDLDRLTAGLQPQNLIIIAARPAMGKCLVGDTRIVDAATGQRWTIAELVAQRPADVVVHALDDRGRLVTVRPDDFVDNGVRNTWRVVTRSGRTARMTSNHPLRTRDGWRELASLAPGDEIAVPRRLQCDSPPSRPTDVGRLAALGQRVGAADRRDADAASYLPERANRPAGAGTMTRVTAARVAAHPLLSPHGPRSLGSETATRASDERPQRHLPDAVFTATTDGRIAFLAAAFSVNATIDRVADGIRLRYATRSPSLARELQHLLLRHGRTSVVGADEDGASLTCVLPPSRAESSTIDAMVSAWLAAPNDGPDVGYEEIVTIEPAGTARVYDLTIDRWHNFVADDLVVHNSSLALGISHYVAARLSRPAIMFSLEMSKIEIVNRLLSSEARIDSSRLRTGRLEESDWRKLGDALGTLAEAPLFIDDTPSISLNEIRAKCRRLQQKHGLDLVIVDYLQLMQSPRRIESRQQEVAEISRGLKMLAKELDVPVIALSQLSRQPESRTDKRPQLADLRESGSIEQDADIVGFIYRDEIYDEDSPDRGIAELIIAKHRNGPTSVVKLAFLDHLTTFANLARGPAPGATSSAASAPPPSTPV